jgi:Tol biopolymer transport system component
MKRWNAALVVATLTLAACSASGEEGSSGGSSPASPSVTQSLTPASVTGLHPSIVGMDGEVRLEVGALPPDAWELNLSPDGETVAYLTWAINVGGCGACSEGGRLAATAIDGSASAFVTLHTWGLPNSVRMPAWSPDGSQIAFVSAQDIYVVRFDDDGPVGQPHRLTTDPGADEFPSWSPDGETIVYDNSGAEGLDGSGLSRTQEIWSVPAAGGRPVRLTHNHLADQAPAFSPDGKRLAFFHDGLIGIMDASGGPIDSLPGDLQGWSPRWSPDGTRIAFLAFEGARASVPDPYTGSEEPLDLPLGVVKVVDVTSGEVASLGVLVPSSYNPVSWLPSGDAVLADVVASGTAG